MKRTFLTLAVLGTGVLALFLSSSPDRPDRTGTRPDQASSFEPKPTTESPSPPTGTGNLSLPDAQSKMPTPLPAYPTPEDLERSYRQSESVRDGQKRRITLTRPNRSLPEDARKVPSPLQSSSSAVPTLDPRTRAQRRQRWLSRRARRDALRIQTLVTEFQLAPNEQTELRAIFDRTQTATLALFGQIDPRQPDTEKIFVGLEEIRQEQRAELQEILGSTRFHLFDQWNREGRFVLEEERRKLPR